MQNKKRLSSLLVLMVFVLVFGTMFMATAPTSAIAIVGVAPLQNTSKTLSADMIASLQNQINQLIKIVQALIVQLGKINNVTTIEQNTNTTSTTNTTNTTNSTTSSVPDSSVPKIPTSVTPTYPTMCAQDVLLCPDGSYVSRSGSNCEFRACSSSNSAVCSYPAAPIGCSYVEGPNFNSTTQCGLMLVCSNSDIIIAI